MRTYPHGILTFSKHMVAATVGGKIHKKHHMYLAWQTFVIYMRRNTEDVANCYTKGKLLFDFTHEALAGVFAPAHLPSGEFPLTRFDGARIEPLGNQDFSRMMQNCSRYEQW